MHHQTHITQANNSGGSGSLILCHLTGAITYPVCDLFVRSMVICFLLAWGYDNISVFTSVVISCEFQLVIIILLLLSFHE